MMLMTTSSFAKRLVYKRTIECLINILSCDICTDDVVRNVPGPQSMSPRLHAVRNRRGPNWIFERVVRLVPDDYGSYIYTKCFLQLL